MDFTQEQVSEILEKIVPLAQVYNLCLINQTVCNRIARIN